MNPNQFKMERMGATPEKILEIRKETNNQYDPATCDFFFVPQGTEKYHIFRSPGKRALCKRFCFNGDTYDSYMYGDIVRIIDYFDQLKGLSTKYFCRQCLENIGLYEYMKEKENATEI